MSLLPLGDDDQLRTRLVPVIRPVPVDPWDPLEAWIVNIHGAGTRGLVDRARRSHSVLRLSLDPENEHGPPVPVAVHSALDRIGPRPELMFCGYLNREAAAVVGPALESGLHLVASVTGALIEPSRGGQVKVVVTFARDHYSVMV